MLLAAAAAYADETGAAHVVASVGGHEAERQRFFARMGFAPLTTRRIVTLESLARSLTAWQRGWPAGSGAAPRIAAATAASRAAAPGARSDRRGGVSVSPSAGAASCR